MTENTSLPERRSIRIRGYDYTQGNAYYITVCVDNRKCILCDEKEGVISRNKYGNIVHEEILRTEKVRENIQIIECIVMPNHFHAVVFIKENTSEKIKGALAGKIKHFHPASAPARLESGSIGAITGQIKSITTKLIRKAGMHDFEWQRNYYEHIVRDEEDLYNIRQYIINNPLKWKEDEYNPNKAK